MSIEEQLSRAFASLDEAVADHVSEHHRLAPRISDQKARARRGRRRWPSLLPVAAAATAVAVVAVAVGLVVAGRDDQSAPPPAQHRTAAPSPSPSPTHTQPDQGDTPSQGASGAARDHVLAAVAALPFGKRVHPTNGDGVSSTEAVTSQGVWVLSTPTWPSSSGCFKAEPRAGLRYSFCDLSGELLLLSLDRKHILRAYPLADEAHWLVQGKGSLYLGAAADGAQPVSMLCRLPLDTLALSCRYFQVTSHVAADGPGWTAALLARWPGQNRLDDVSALPTLYQLRVTATALVGTDGPGSRSSTRFDPVTLEPLP